jgi:hypothetical protein
MVDARHAEAVERLRSRKHREEKPFALMYPSLPAIEGGMAVYQERADYERGSTLGHYDKPQSFPADSSYRRNSAGFHRSHSPRDKCAHRRHARLSPIRLRRAAAHRATGSNSAPGHG